MAKAKKFRFHGPPFLPLWERNGKSDGLGRHDPGDALSVWRQIIVLDADEAEVRELLFGRLLFVAPPNSGRTIPFTVVLNWAAGLRK